MKILLTGIAGFIGSHLAKKLAEQGHEVIGIDNLNDYYDPTLKLNRLRNLGIEVNDPADNASIANTDPDSEGDGERYAVSSKYPNLRFIRMDIADEQAIDRLFEEEKFDIAVHLAAQAGARDSVRHPRNYLRSNVSGFLNILEGCRTHNLCHLIYASSSSVYGLNGKVPFSEHDPVGHPVSLYAATKRSDELMAHAYSHLYGLPTTGLRLFTVYGPWGRPDMAPYLFIDAVSHDREINIYNNGEMLRDFTYIDDVVEAICAIIPVIPSGNKEWDPQHPDQAKSPAPFRLLNVGNSNPVRLMDFIDCIEKELGKEARKNFLPMQKGDVTSTYSDSSELHRLTGFAPSTPLRDGIAETIKWMKSYLD